MVQGEDNRSVVRVNVTSFVFQTNFFQEGTMDVQEGTMDVVWQNLSPWDCHCGYR